VETRVRIPLGPLAPLTCANAQGDRTVVEIPLLGGANMTIILVMSETLPLSEIKAHLSEVVDRVEEHHERVTLTRNGKPAAVLISPVELEALEDTLELLSDPSALAEIEKARKEIARGKGLTAAEMKARYLHK
jgi:antitoxin YefM